MAKKKKNQKNNSKRKSLSPFDQNKATIMSFLKEIGAKSAHIEFSGSGDSGKFDSIHLVFPPQKGNAVDELIEANTYDDKVKLSLVEVKPSSPYECASECGELSLSEALESMGNTVLNKQGLDWYNNDGGQGTITFDPVKNKIIAKTGVNYTETSQHEDEY